MKLYFAPLEGIGGRIYRNTHRSFFEDCDAYFAPFITPSELERVSRKGLKDVLPEKNPGQNLKVQVLANHKDAILPFAEKIKSYGYEELNLNAGCPYPRVVNKGRGAGLLLDKDALNRLLDEVFSAINIKFSVKTRAGFYKAEELEELMEIYNQYPISLLTVHPRAREDFYAGEPDKEAFSAAYSISKNPLCYNGNILTKEDFEEIIRDFPNLDSVMIGRGAIKNPAIFREIKGGKKLSTQELQGFSQALLENYYEELKSEVFTLQKMKEVWNYMIQNYPEEKKIAKQIKKANKLADLQEAISRLPEL